MTTAKPILPALTPEQRRRVLDALDHDVDRSGGPAACWPWTGGTITRGYGIIYTGRDGGRHRLIKAHRLAHELGTGECPPAVDHTCHKPDTCPSPGENCPHRRCCNPAHLTGTTIGANAGRDRARADTCGAGHPMAGDNVYEIPGGGRRCRACGATRARESRALAKQGREQNATQRPRTYRPRGMNREQLVAWGLKHNTGDGCWTWHNHTLGQGYPHVGFEGRNVAVHRLVYEDRHGEIPDGMVIDHICHDPATCPGGHNCPHRSCCNPAHLQLATPATNVAPDRASHVRPDECSFGHAFTPENTYTDKQGRRHCMTCRRERDQVARDEAKAQRGAIVDGRLRQDGLCKSRRHRVDETGLTKNGRCRACRNEATNERRRKFGRRN